MSAYDNNEAYNSPMEVVFSWATPQTSGGASTAIKRKSQDDSGYGSPCSSNKQRTVQSTPCAETRRQIKRLLTMATPKDQQTEFFYNSVAAPDSYSDFLMEASLYSEPMELDNSSCLTASLSECKDSLTFTEKTNDLDVAFETASCVPCASTPEYSPPSKITLTTIRKPDCSSLSPRKRLISSAPGQTIFWQKFKRPRNLTGAEHVDFLSQLGVKADYRVLLSTIFSYLSDSDLSNVTMVSNAWRSVCLADASANQRWHAYVNDRKGNIENLHQSGKSSEKTKRLPSLRDYNHSTPLVSRQPISPPVSPSKVRFHMFQKEAKKLKENEVLMECPRCRRPSACSPHLRIGECSSLFCQMKFCTICKTVSHPGDECPFLTPATPTTPTKRSVSIGSKQSRRNLRRL